MESLNDRLKKKRKEIGLSQTAVAELAGITQSAYAQIENGNTKSITIEAGKGIAEALGISFNVLFDIETVQIGSEAIQKIANQLQAKNQLLEQRIFELEKRIEEKDLVIEMLKKENHKFKINESINFIDVWFENFINDEIKARQAKTEEEKNAINKYPVTAINQLKLEIEKSLKEGLLTIEKIISLLFLNDDFCNLIESESNSKDMFIDKCTVIINKFCNVNNDQVQNVIEGFVITKWDTEKVKNRRIRRIQSE